MKKIVKLLFIFLFIVCVGGINTYAEEEVVPIISVGALSYNSINVSFDNPGYEGYEIYRSSYPNKGFVKITDTTNSNYVDQKLIYNKYYYYKIRAYKMVEGMKVYSNYSNVAYTRPNLNVPLANAEPVGSGAIRIYYQRVPGATRYEIFQSTDNKNFKIIKRTVSDSFISRNLKADKTYYYKVRCYRTVGRKNYFSAISYVSQKTNPAIPNFFVSSTNISTADLIISQNINAIGYDIYRSIGNNGKGPYIYLNTTTNMSYTDTNLISGEAYYYKISPYVTINERKYNSNLSNAKGVVIKLKIPTLTLTDSKSESIKLSFQPNNTIFSGYEIYRSIDNINYTFVARTSSANYVDEGLAANTFYYYKILAWRSAGSIINKSEYSISHNLQTKTGIPKITIISNSDKSVRLKIEEAAGAEGYEFYRKSPADSEYKLILLDNLQYDDSEVQRGKTYYYRARSYKIIDDEKVYGDFYEFKVICGNSKVIYLTFDDGPSSYTSKLLDILKKYNVKATFFVTGQRSSSYDKYIIRAHKEGHTVALHTYTHSYKKVYTSISGYFSDLNKISDKVYKLTGVRSKIIRFPGGSSNTVSRNYSKKIMTKLTQEVNKRGYHYYDWNVSGGDTATSNSTKIANNVIRGLKSNKKYYVVLQHDTKKASVNAVEAIIKYGLKNGYIFAPLDMSSPVVHHGLNN